MNWELIRILIDVLTILMAIVFTIVLYVAFKSYRNVAGTIKPLMSVGKMFETEEEEGKENDRN